MEWPSEKATREKQQDKAFAMWLACATQQEIADAVGAPQQTVADWLKGFTEKSAADKSVFSSDFDPPIYGR